MVASLQEIGIGLIVSFLISSVFWLVLWQLFGNRFNPLIAILLLGLTLWVVSLLFDITGGIVFIFNVAIIATLNNVINPFTFAAILGAIGIVAVGISVIAVIITDQVEASNK